MFTNMLKMSIKRFSHSPLLTHLTSNNLKVKIFEGFLRVLLHSSVVAL